MTVKNIGIKYIALCDLFVYSLYSHTTPQHFIEVATAFLELNELDNNLIIGLVGGLTDKTVMQNDWKFLSVIDEDKVVAVSVKMGPRVLISCPPQNEEAIKQLAAYYLSHLVPVAGVFGEKATAMSFAKHIGLRETDYKEMIVYELTQIQPVSLSPGVFKEATVKDIDVIARMVEAFEKETFGPSGKSFETIRYETALRIERRLVYTWSDASGKILSMAIFVRHTAHIGIIGYVYSPVELRGMGYATSLVWSLSKKIKSQGFRACGLFADKGNIASNIIYRKIGYRPGTIFADIYFG